MPLHHIAKRTLARLSRRALFCLGGLALVLIAIRLLLPFAVKAYVNRQLSRTADFKGTVEDIDIHLIRGAYTIQRVKIFKTTSQIPVPLFSAERIDLSIQWKELLHGALVGEIDLWKPELRIVSGPTEAESQTGKDQAWGDTIAGLFPFKFNRVRIEDGAVHFQNFHSHPRVDIHASRLFLLATNLTNARDLNHHLPAGVAGHCQTLGDGSLDIVVQMNPLAHPPAFEFSGQLTNVHLTSLNDFLKAYGKFDVERGTFALFASVAAKDGAYDGYAKVFFDNLDVFEWEKERKKNALQIFWHAIVGTVSTAFRNQSEDRLATKIPFSGSFENRDIGVWAAITTLMRNAFVRALVPKLDDKVKLEEVREKEAP